MKHRHGGGRSPKGDTTFRGRGLATREGDRLILVVCPVCSQKNSRHGAEAFVCEWCAYRPSLSDAEPRPSGS